MNTCTFCGHETVPDGIRDTLFSAVRNMIESHSTDFFYVGNQGQFDRLALTVLSQLKKEYPHIRFYVALAYMPGAKPEFPLADELETVYPDGLETVPRRFAISHRNRWMVDRSKYLIAYVNHDYGGAAQTLRYAKGKGTIEIINLAHSFG